MTKSEQKRRVRLVRLRQTIKEELEMEAINQVKPQRVESIIVNDDTEAPSLLNPMTGEIFVTNPVGQQIFELADGSATLEDIIEAVAARFDGASRDVIKNDALAFFDNANNRGLVTWQD